MKRISLTTLLLLALSFQQAHSTSTAEQSQWLLLGAPATSSDYLSTPSLSVQSGAPTASLNLRFSQPLGTFTSFFSSFSVVNNNHPFGQMTENSITSFQSGIEWFFTQPQKMQWFLSGGMGSTHIDRNNQPDSTHPVVSVGLGQNWAINSNDSMRWELRANQAFGKDEMPDWAPVNFQAIFSYQWGN